MSEIHLTAIVEDGARIGKKVRIGAYSVIGPEVVLKDDVVVHPHVAITGRTEIGERTEIMSFAALGGSPQDTSYRNEPTSVVIGADCVIHSNATLYRDIRLGDRVIVHSGTVIADGDSWIFFSSAALPRKSPSNTRK